MLEIINNPTVITVKYRFLFYKNFIKNTIEIWPLLNHPYVGRYVLSRFIKNLHRIENIKIITHKISNTSNHYEIPLSIHINIDLTKITNILNETIEEIKNDFFISLRKEDKDYKIITSEKISLLNKFDLIDLKDPESLIIINHGKGWNDIIDLIDRIKSMAVYVYMDGEEYTPLYEMKRGEKALEVLELYCPLYLYFKIDEREEHMNDKIVKELIERYKS